MSHFFDIQCGQAERFGEASSASEVQRSIHSKTIIVALRTTLIHVAPQRLIYARLCLTLLLRALPIMGFCLCETIAIFDQFQSCNISEVPPLLTKSTSPAVRISAAGISSIVCMTPQSKKRLGASFHTRRYSSICHANICF